jgi:hypothetical protein
MKAVLSARASRPWLGVALLGLIVVVFVIALGLVPRLGAGQDVLDAAKPAVTDARVAGDRAGVDFVSKYVDLADPLMTVRGGGSKEVDELVALVAHRAKLSRRTVRGLLHEEAPHTEALLRALPLSAAAREVPAFTDYLATTLNLPEDDLAAEVEETFPKLSQTLSALPSVTDGWNDIPGADGLTRFDGRTPVSTVPAVRDYLSADLVATLQRKEGDVRSVASNGGIGYIPWLLLVIGVAMLVYGLLQAWRAAKAPRGKRAWAGVAVLGVVILGLVLVMGYVPRLGAAGRVTSDFEPAFAQPRVQGDRAGVDMLHQTVLFGDPIMTAQGGAGAEVPQLYAFVSSRTNLSRDKIRAALDRRAPRISALLQAIPLSAVADEVPHFMRVLAKRLQIPPDELVARLRRRTPRLTQSLLAAQPVTLGWNAIPGTTRLTDFDGTMPVRTMPALDQYLSTDVIPVIETQRENFRDLADPWPGVSALPWLLIAVGALVLLYGVAMMRWSTKPPRAPGARRSARRRPTLRRRRA